ncbi:MAG: flagellar biosynthesis protein FlhB [Pseudomonadota bacterium]
MADSDQEKTEPATGKKLEDARGKGQVALSREVPSVMILIAVMGVFYFTGGWMLALLSGTMTDIFAHLNSYRAGSIPAAHRLLMHIFSQILLLLTPVLLAVIFCGITGNVMQIGFQVTTEPLMPKLEKLDPINGIKKLISLKSLMELLKSGVKLIVVGSVAYLVAKRQIDDIPGLMNMTVGQILVFFGEAAFQIAFFVCLALIAVAVLDFAFQKWQHAKELRMTKQEVKDEMRQTMGDPQIKGRIRKMQREMSRQRMMAAVPRADVVITNPTHLAIALEFDAASMDAPRVLAMGAGEVARRIREIAAENGIPLVEQKPLARALFKTVEVGGTIPVDLYRAVAEVLAYVYRLKGKTGGRSEQA